MFRKSYLLLVALLFVFISCDSEGSDSEDGVNEQFTDEFIDEVAVDLEENMYPTIDDGTRLELVPEDLAGKEHHTRHEELFGKYIFGYNVFILEAVDEVQSIFPYGGSYMSDTNENVFPPESPVGFELSLFGNKLIDPPRVSSYCTGAVYAALIEFFNIIFEDRGDELSDSQLEAMMMQEDDGTARENYVKFWGCFNAPYGNQLALVDYTDIGRIVEPINARPGDIVFFKKFNGLGHMAIFLGYYVNFYGEKKIIYWSSQRRTNGFGDYHTSIADIEEVLFVRITNPENLFKFDINKVNRVEIEGDSFDW